MPRSASPSKFASLGSLLLVSALIGLVSAFIIFPVFGGAGVVAKAAAASFDSLPTDLKTPPLPQRSTILAADGSILASFYSENRITVSLDEVPDSTRKAVVAIEDSRFYEHNGIDTRGIVRAFVRNQQSGQYSQGASTLTQQYVKRVLLEQAIKAGDLNAVTAATDKNKARKLREIRYALALEDRLSKDQILERYLNIAYFGAGAYGIGTAAQVYFGKPVSKLTLPESALLAGLLQSPSSYDPFHGKVVAATNRRDVVLARMADLKFITRAEADKAEREPLRLRRSVAPNGCLTSRFGHFCDYVRRFLLDDPGMGPTREARQARLFRGGLTIKTTIDPHLQRLADEAVSPSFPQGSKYVAGLAVVQPGTGRVKALALSRPFAADQNPYLTTSRLQTGSTAKAFVLTAALQKGLPLTLTIDSPHDYTSKVFTTYDKGVKGPYKLSNDSSGMYGPYDMRSGIAASVNTYYVQLEERVGVDNAARAAMLLGVHNPVDTSGTNKGHPEFEPFLKYPLGYGSFTLGVAGITPLDMANAYATLAAHGKRCATTPIEWVIDSSRHRLDIGARSCQQAIEPGVADAATEALSWAVHPKGPVTNGNTAGRADIGAQPVAGKTGTTQDIKEAWFVGYAPQLSGAAVVFDPKHQVTLPGGDRSNRISVMAWARFMKPALAGSPIVKFPPVQEKYLHGQSTTVPDVTGLSVSQATTRLAQAGFGVQVSSYQVNAAPTPAGLVGDSSPNSGTTTTQGSLVILYLSTGNYQPAPSPQPSPTPTAAPPPSPSASPRPKPSPSKKRCPPINPNCK